MLDTFLSFPTLKLAHTRRPGIGLHPSLEKSVRLETEGAGRDLETLFSAAFVIQKIKSMRRQRFSGEEIVKKVINVLL